MKKMMYNKLVSLLAYFIRKLANKRKKKKKQTIAAFKLEALAINIITIVEFDKNLGGRRFIPKTLFKYLFLISKSTSKVNTAFKGISIALLTIYMNCG